MSGERGTAVVGDRLKQLLETDEYAPAGGAYADVVYDMDMVQEEPPAQAAPAPQASAKPAARGKKAAASGSEQQQQPASKRTRKK